MRTGNEILAEAETEAADLELFGLAREAYITGYIEGSLAERIDRELTPEQKTERRRRTIK